MITIHYATLLALILTAFAVGIFSGDKDHDDSAKGLALLCLIVAVLVFTVRITLYFNL